MQVERMDNLKTGGQKIPLAMFIDSSLRYPEMFLSEQIRLQARFDIRPMAYKTQSFAPQAPNQQKTVLNPIENFVFRYSGYAQKIDKSIRQFKPALIHAHFGTRGVQTTSWVRKYGIPLAITFHSNNYGGLKGANRLSWRKTWFHLSSKKMFRYSDLLIATTSQIQTILTERFHQPEQKVRLIRTGIPIERFKYIKRPNRSVQLLMCGRLVKSCGFEYGISAFARAKHHCPGIHLTIMGMGPLQKRYMQIVNSHRIDKNVTFVHGLCPDKMRALFNKSDILLVPSIDTGRNGEESGTLVVKEAGATGMAVVATRHGELPEIIEHGTTGYLAPEKNVDVLTHYLEKLSKSYDRREYMGGEARRKMEREYDSRNQNALLEDALFEMVAKSPKPKQKETFST